jgi:hypothetical protein
MRRQLVLGLMLVAVLGGPLCASDGGGVSATTRPVNDRASLGRLLRELASDDGMVRERARVALMRLTRSDLLALRAAVGESVPLEPGQIAALREVVMHVALVGAPYEGMETGFLGVMLPDRLPEDRYLVVGRGVIVKMRLPGFCAFRELQDGDIILSASAAGVTVAVNDANELIATVGKVVPGETVRFDVVRQGEIRSVSIVLDRRPVAADPQQSPAGALEDFLGTRSELAAGVWEREFLPLLGERVG